MNKFESLPIFHEAHTFVLLVYKETAKFPSEEKYGLTSQLRRSSSSIPANIIEGNSRRHKKKYLEFLYFAKGSLEESKYHLLLARDLSYMSSDEYEELLLMSENIGRQLNGLIQYITKQIAV